MVWKIRMQIICTIYFYGIKYFKNYWVLTEKKQENMKEGGDTNRRWYVPKRL